MNWIGEFGNFIVEHQETVELILMILAVLAAVGAVVWLINGSRKKRKLLTRISADVAQLNSAVKGLGEKKSDVIYIDNRTSAGQAQEKNLPNIPGVTCASGAEAAEETAERVGAESDPGDEQQAAEKAPEPEEPKEAEETPVRKFFDRDCGTSKNGKTYTVEELKQQIKE